MPEVNPCLYQFLNQRLRHNFPAFDRYPIISAMTVVLSPGGRAVYPSQVEPSPFPIEKCLSRSERSQRPLA
jgi:hypothetical protein